MKMVTRTSMQRTWSPTLLFYPFGMKSTGPPRRDDVVVVSEW